MPGRDPFTTADALRAGWSQWAIRDKVSSGHWVVLRYGVFCTSDRLLAATDLRTRHALDVVAAMLAMPRPTVASGWTAAILADLPLPRRFASVRPEVTLTTSIGRGRRLLGMQVRAAPVPSDQLGTYLELPMTSPARTAVDLALHGSGPGFADELAVADAVLHRGLASEEEMACVLANFARRPGHRRAVRILGIADAKAETPLESHSRAFFDEQRIPMPDSQVEIRDENDVFVARVDFLWPKTIGEADGRLKYAAPEDLYREKRREDRLRELGFEVVRWDYSDIWSRPAQTARRITAAIRRGAAR